MHAEPSVLARYEGFGSVARCRRGCVHVQLGGTTLTLTEFQYQRLVAMLVDSAAAFERQRGGFDSLASDAVPERLEDERPDFQQGSYPA